MVGEGGFEIVSELPVQRDERVVVIGNTKHFCVRAEFGGADANRNSDRFHDNRHRLAQQVSVPVLHGGALEKTDPEHIGAFQQRGKSGDTAERGSSDASVFAAFLHTVMRSDVGQDFFCEKFGNVCALKIFGPP